MKQWMQAKSKNKSHFAPIFWCQKLQSCVLGLKFFVPKYWQKSKHIMLMKLTPAVNF